MNKYDVAAHEAGHAVVARQLGVKVDRVVIYPTGGGACYLDGSRSIDPFDDVVLSLAGAEGEKREDWYLTGGASDSDIDAVSDALARLRLTTNGNVSDLQDAAREKAREIVYELRDVVDAVAQELAERESLTGEEVDAIIARAKANRDPAIKPSWFIGTRTEFELQKELAERDRLLGIKPGERKRKAAAQARAARRNKVVASSSPNGWVATKAFRATSGENVSEGEWVANGHELVAAHPGNWKPVRGKDKDGLSLLLDAASGRAVARSRYVHRAVRP